MEKEKEALQDLIGPANHCHGCGVGNPGGFYLKSYWDDDEAVAVWKASAHHTAGSPDYVNGGILASLIDCHSNNLAMASSYHRAGRPVGSTPHIWCVTAQLKVDYKKPVPIDQEIHLRARILKNERRKTRVECLLSIKGEICARGEVLLIEIQRK
jgi:acyl-coenzyme A thioesterase PaaI-like protein